MRILLWHGYLLGGTGSNVYTRALAREWSRAGHDVVVVCQEPHPERYDLGGAKVFRPNVGGLLPVFVLDRYEGLEAKLLQDFTRGRARPLRRAQRDGVVRADAGRPGLREPRAARRAGRLGERNAVRGQGARLGARVLDARQRRARDLGARGARARQKPSSSGRRTSAASWRRSSATSSACTRCRPASTSRSSGPTSRDEALARLLEEARADAANPATPNERQPDEGNAARLEEFFATDEPTVVYFGKLLHNKGVHVLLEALRGVDARAVIVGFGDYRQELERDRPAGGRSSPGRSNTDTSCTCSRSPTSRSCRRSSPRPSEWSPRRRRLQARRRSSPVIPASRRSRRAWRPSIPPSSAHLASFASGDAADLAAKLERAARASARSTSGARRSGPARRRRAVELDEHRRTPARADRQRLARIASFTLVTWVTSNDSLPRSRSRSAREAFEDGHDFTIAVEEEFALLDPDTLELTNRFEELKAGAAGTALDEHLVGELIASEIEVKTGRCAELR